MVKRSPKPCKLCNGKSKIRCMICGWKTNEKVAFRDLTKMEQLKIIGKREYYKFIHGLDSSSTRAGNCTTEVESVDSQIEKHRREAHQIYLRVENGEDVREIAKELQLTAKMVLNMVELVRRKIARNDFVFKPNPPTPHTPLPKPVAKVYPKRVRLGDMEVEPEPPDQEWIDF